MSNEWRLYISGSGKPIKFHNYVPFYLTDKKRSQRGHSSAVQIPGRKAPIIHYGGTDAINLRLNAKIRLGDDSLEDYERGFSNLEWHMSKDWGGRQLDFSQLNSADENTISYETGTDILETTGYRHGLHDQNWPQILYHKGMTHVVYGYNDGTTAPDAYYIGRNHSSSRWGTPVKIADIPLTNNDHGNPAIHITNDEYLHCFYGAHGGSPLLYKKSTNKNDGTAWGNVATITVANKYPAYPHPHNIDDGKNVVLFQRTTSGVGSETETGWWSLRKSTDSCDSWETPVDIIRDNLWTPYVRSVIGSESPTKSIHLAWIQYSYSGGQHKGVFYAQSLDGGATWQKTDGTSLSLPITTTSAEQITLSDITEHCKVLDVGVDKNNNPRITYFITPTESHGQTDYFTVYFAKYDVTDGDWKITTLSTVGSYDTFLGAKFYYTDDNVLLMPIAELDSGKTVKQLIVYKSEDDGESWEKIETVSTTTYPIDIRHPQPIMVGDEGLMEIVYTTRLTSSGQNYCTISYHAYPYGREMVNSVDYQIDEGSGRKDWYSARLNLMRNKNW